MVLNVSDGHFEPHSLIEQGRMTDSEARKLLSQLCGDDLATLKTMPKDNRKLIIRKAISSGINMRQLSRITGIEYRSIYLVINPKQKNKT
jgi:hypothetical protein